MPGGRDRLRARPAAGRRDWRSTLDPPHRQGEHRLEPGRGALRPRRAAGRASAGRSSTTERAARADRPHRRDEAPDTSPSARAPASTRWSPARPGPGKSTLFHVIITNLALWCSPEQVEFYLVDFKKGVEFKCYATKRLPHARVVAIESDREFGLSVLQRVDEELKRRGDLFRKLGRAGPRRLQARRRHGADAAHAADDRRVPGILHRGRPRSRRTRRCCWTASCARAAPSASTSCSARRRSAAPTRWPAPRSARWSSAIALQCNEADAYLIMDDDNPAPRLLTRPGEGIYNDTAGALGGEQPVPDRLAAATRSATQWLDEVAALAEERGWKDPRRRSSSRATRRPTCARTTSWPRRWRSAPTKRAGRRAAAWLGAPNSIKGPTEAVFQRQSGSHLLVVGQREERGRGDAGRLAGLAGRPVSRRMARVSSCSTRRRRSPRVPRRGWRRSCRTTVDGGAPPHDVGGGDGGAGGRTRRRASRARRTAAGGVPARPRPAAVQASCGRRMTSASRWTTTPAGPNPAKVFQDLLSEGRRSACTCSRRVDTWNNVSRWIQRKVAGRVRDAGAVPDERQRFGQPDRLAGGQHARPAPGAALQRALGTVETFRPYAEPGGIVADGSAIRMVGASVPVREPRRAEPARNSPKAEPSATCYASSGTSNSLRGSRRSRVGSMPGVVTVPAAGSTVIALPS